MGIYVQKKKIIWKVKEIGLGFLFPRRCPVCDEIAPVGEKICSDCKKRVKYIGKKTCMRCGKPIEASRMEYCYDCTKKKHEFYQGKSVFLYADGIKESMYRFKYQNKREYADYYAEEAIRLYRKWMEEHQIEVIMPVPMYRAKKRLRGYNQAEVFARELSKKTRIPVENELVVRIENTPALKLLNYAERKNALDGAFQVRKNIVNCYKSILLVDDIYTTGSTAEEISRMLKQSGNINVYLLCICIGKQD